MFRYLKAAFFVKLRAAGLGAVPVNVVAAVCFAILGFGNPGFWLLGLGLEAAFLTALATNRRFQSWVDAMRLTTQRDLAATKKEALLKLISPDDKKRLSALEEKCVRTLEVYRTSQLEPVLLDNNTAALERICYLYLKILVSRRYLTNLAGKDGERLLRQKIEEMRKSLEGGNIPDSLRASKNATLRILEQRVSNLQRREESLDEMESDLTRIEAQVDIALENASMRGKPHTISADVDLNSQLFDGSLYMDAGPIIMEMDRNLASSPGPSVPRQAADGV